MENFDLVIVGAGIGGSALGAVMARGGCSVLLLEQSKIYEDRVCGEWIAPWGVAEAIRLGLYDLLVAAGGHHIGRHVSYDERLEPAEAEAASFPLNGFREGVPGPLSLRHPIHCQTLFDAALAAGAKGLRGVNVTDISAGEEPCVSFEHDGQTHEVHARLLVGADGRLSPVREAVGIRLHQDAPHHWFAGLLVEGVENWNADLQAIGTEGDFCFLTFPQGGGRVRIYGGYPLSQTGRFKGPDGPRRFLDAFAMTCSPNNRHIVAGRPAGPLRSYINADSWTDEPFSKGVVLVGDAAGWNDPILGLGLSITYRDVRTVSDLLKGDDDWSNLSFSGYAEERAERMRRLRFTASLHATLDMEFGDGASARRHSLFQRSATDPSLRAHALAVMAGPEMLPPEVFTEQHRARVLGEAVSA